MKLKQIYVEKNLLKGIRLNRYLAHSGVSSRRTSETFIKTGIVEINGKIVKEPGYRVFPNDRSQRFNSMVFLRIFNKVFIQY